MSIPADQEDILSDLPDVTLSIYFGDDLETLPFEISEEQPLYYEFGTARHEHEDGGYLDIAYVHVDDLDRNPPQSEADHEYLFSFMFVLGAVLTPFLILVLFTQA